MNAYLVLEQGDHTVWVAPTMQRALELAWTDYRENNELPDDPETRDEYEDDVIESCSLLGKVGNP